MYVNMIHGNSIVWDRQHYWIPRSMVEISIVAFSYFDDYSYNISLYIYTYSYSWFLTPRISIYFPFVILNITKIVRKVVSPCISFVFQFQTMMMTHVNLLWFLQGINLEE